MGLDKDLLGEFGTYTRPSTSLNTNGPVKEISLNISEFQYVELTAHDFDFIADLQPFHQPIHFSYNLRTGHSVYRLYNMKVPDLTAITCNSHPRIHPFSIHLALLQQEIMARVDPMARGLAKMLKIESRLLDDPLPELIALNVVRKDIQELHKIARSFILSENRASRNLSNVNNLLLDLKRLKLQTESCQDYLQLDPGLHERVHDGFISLRESCNTILRRLKNRRERISNHIQLVRTTDIHHLLFCGPPADFYLQLYNLRADRDSQEIRRDSTVMRKLATLTILFLPTTFLSSAFAIAASQSSTGPSTFAVSNMWWIYLLSVLSLTLVSAGVWMWLLRRRKRESATGGGEV